MPRIKLTERVIPALKAKSKNERARSKNSKSKEPVFWFDKTTPGFAVSVSLKKTGLMSYIVQRTLPNGKDRRFAFAAVGELALDEARAKARDIIHDMRLGVDPRAARKGALTLRQVMESYLTRDRLSERSRKDYRDNIERHLRDWLDTKLIDVSGQMVMDRHAKIGADVGKAVANSVFRGYRALHNYALIRNPSLPPNPALWLRGHWFKIQPRNRRVKADELPAFYKAVLALPNPVQRDYLLFALFTGIRREQAAALDWAFVDFAARVIRFPGDVTKAKSEFNMPMTDFVYDLLRARRELGDSAWVFPANSKSCHISEPARPFELIEQMVGIHWSIHDVRKTYADALDATEMSAYALKALLHHSHGRTNGDVTSGYLSMQTERLREPAQRACNVLKRWCGIE